MPIKHFFLILCVCISFLACSHQPSKVELMRQQKAEHDSVTYAQAKQNLYYSDSVLQSLLPQTDPLMQQFVYSKNDKAEDHGHYVHRLLQTTSNTTRNFLQAYISDNRVLSVQSYFYGSQQQHQRAIRLSSGEDYIEKEGSNHAFEAEGWHEILTIEGNDAIQLLAFINDRASDRVRVEIIGSRSVAYDLTRAEKQALSETYQLAALMSNIDALERAIHVSNLQIQKYEKKHVIQQ